jgi:hypothetical protein
MAASSFLFLSAFKGILILTHFRVINQPESKLARKGYKIK